MKNKVEKGQQGYIGKQKRFQLSVTILLASISVGLYVFGYLITDYSNANAFTVLSMLMVLPAAKFLVSLIVLFPYKSASTAQYIDVNKQKKDSVVFYTDLVMTSKDKVMNLDYLLVGEKQVIGLIGKANQDSNYIEAYLTKGVNNWAPNYQVKIYKDYTQFIGQVPNLDSIQLEEEQTNILAYIRSLMM